VYVPRRQQHPVSHLPLFGSRSRRLGPAQRCRAVVVLSYSHAPPLCRAGSFQDLLIDERCSHSDCGRNLGGSSFELTYRLGEIALFTRTFRALNLRGHFFELPADPMQPAPPLSALGMGAT